MNEEYRHLVTDGYEFEFSEYFSKGWETFKKGAGSFIGFALVAIICIYAVSAIFSALINPIFLTPMILDGGDLPGTGFWVSLGGAMFLQNAVVTIFQWCLLGGYYIFCRNVIAKRDEFGQFFEGFKFFKPISKFYFIWLLILIPITIVMVSSIFPVEFLPTLLSGDFDNMEYVMQDFIFSLSARIPLFLILMLVMMAVYILYSLTLPLIVDGKMGAWEAMETSRKVVAKKFFHFFGLYFVVGLLVIVGGTITCFLGLLVLFPYMMCIQFTAYDRIFKPVQMENEDSLEAFGKSEQDVNTESEEN